jgi:hypothetical protein
MSIIYYEGFDDGRIRAIGNLGAHTSSAVLNFGRTGRYGLSTAVNSAVGNRNSVYRIAIPNTTTGFVNFAFYTTTLSSNGKNILQLTDIASSVIHLSIRLLANGQFGVYRADTTFLVGSNYVYPVGTWAHCSFKWTIDDSTGLIEGRFNGATVTDFTFSGDTRNAGVASVNTVDLGMLGPVADIQAIYQFDDIIIQDTMGAAPQNTWLGDTECVYIFPTGSGYVSEWGISGSSPAATLWQSVNEVPSNESSSMVGSNTVGNKLLMSYPPSASGTIYGVAPVIRGLKSGSGTRQIVGTISSSTNQYVTSSIITLSSAFVTYAPTLITASLGGTPITANYINNSQFGIELIT